MTISGKYELLRPVGVAGFRSFHARHILTGQEVMLHFLEAGQHYQPAGEQTAAAVDARSQILDAGASDGTQFLVTYPVADFTLLHNWLDTVAPARTAAAPPAQAASAIQSAYVLPAPAPLAPAAPAGAGEFTQMFGSERGRPPAPTTSPGGGASMVAGFQDVSPRPATNPGRDSGSFTARFGNMGSPAPAAVPPPPPAAPAAPSGAGEFTQMFARPPAPVPSAPPAAFPARPAAAPMPAARDSSESRMMFRVPPAVGLPPAAPPPPTPPPAPGAGAGEFTLMFQNPGVPSPPAGDRHAGAAMDREFAQEFLGNDRGGLPPAPSELARPGLAPKPVTAVPAGEFTMMFNGGSSAPAASAPPAPPPQSPPRYDPGAAAAPPPASAAGHGVFEGATQVFSAPSSPYAAPRPMQGAPAGPGEFTMVMQGGVGGGGGSPDFPPPPPPPPAPGGGAGGSMPGLSVQAPAIHKPQVSMPSLSAPSMTGPSVSANGITPPSMQAPHLSAPAISAPSISAPRLDARMPDRAAAGGAGSSSSSSGIPPLLIALLSCLATVAVLAIVYVLLKK